LAALYKRKEKTSNYIDAELWEDGLTGQSMEGMVSDL